MTAQSAYQTYVETTVTISDPLELTRMLYRAAIQAILSARRSLAAGDARARAMQISRAQEIVFELVSSLNAESSPELAQQLTRLYEYVLHLLQTANFEQRDEPLGEAQRLLETLLQGWEQCESASPSAALPGLTAA